MIVNATEYLFFNKPYQILNCALISTHSLFSPNDQNMFFEKDSDIS